MGREDEPHSVLLLELMSTGRPILLAVMKVWVWRRMMGLCGFFEGQGSIVAKIAVTLLRAGLKGLELFSR